MKKSSFERILGKFNDTVSLKPTSDGGKKYPHSRKSNVSPSSRPGLVTSLRPQRSAVPARIATAVSAGTSRVSRVPGRSARVEVKSLVRNFQNSANAKQNLSQTVSKNLKFYQTECKTKRNQRNVQGGGKVVKPPDYGRRTSVCSKVGQKSLPPPPIRTRRSTDTLSSSSSGNVKGFTPRVTFVKNNIFEQNTAVFDKVQRNHLTRNNVQYKMVRKRATRAVKSARTRRKRDFTHARGKRKDLTEKTMSRHTYGIGNQQVSKSVDSDESCDKLQHQTHTETHATRVSSNKYESECRKEDRKPNDWYIELKQAIKLKSRNSTESGPEITCWQPDNTTESTSSELSVSTTSYFNDGTSQSDVFLQDECVINEIVPDEKNREEYGNQDFHSRENLLSCDSSYKNEYNALSMKAYINDPRIDQLSDRHNCEKTLSTKKECNVNEQTLVSYNKETCRNSKQTDLPPLQSNSDRSMWVSRRRSLRTYSASEVASSTTAASTAQVFSLKSLIKKFESLSGGKEEASTPVSRTKSWLPARGGERVLILGRRELQCKGPGLSKQHSNTPCTKSNENGVGPSACVTGTDQRTHYAQCTSVIEQSRELENSRDRKNMSCPLESTLCYEFENTGVLPKAFDECNNCVDGHASPTTHRSNAPTVRSNAPTVHDNRESTQGQHIAHYFALTSSDRGGRGHATCDENPYYRDILEEEEYPQEVIKCKKSHKFMNLFDNLAFNNAQTSKSERTPERAYYMP